MPDTADRNPHYQAHDQGVIHMPENRDYGTKEHPLTRGEMDAEPRVSGAVTCPTADAGQPGDGRMNIVQIDSRDWPARERLAVAWAVVAGLPLACVVRGGCDQAEVVDTPVAVENHSEEAPDAQKCGLCVHAITQHRLEHGCTASGCACIVWGPDIADGWDV